MLSLPKGHKEDGETLLQTAIRECFEETNVVINPENVVDEMPSYFYEFFTPENEMICKTITPFHFEVDGCAQPLCKEKRVLSCSGWISANFSASAPTKTLKILLASFSKKSSKRCIAKMPLGIENIFVLLYNWPKGGYL